MIRLGLRTKIILCFVTSMILVGFLTVVFVRAKVSNTLKEQYQSKGKSMAVNLSVRGTHLILTQDYLALQDLANDLLKNDKDVSYVFIVDKDHRVLAHTFGEGFPRELLKGNVPVLDRPYTTQLFDTEEGLIRDIAVPILGGKIGTTHVGMSEQGIRQTIASVTMIIIGIVAAVLALGTIIVGIVGTFITRSVRQLTQAAQEISHGDFNQQIEVKGKDEIGQLTESFNKMSRNLQEQREKLTALANEQRHLHAQLFQQEKMSVIGQLAASIAHELNTPLNTIVLQTQLLEQDLIKQGFKDEEKLSDLRTLETEAQRCKLIVQNLLDFSRQSQGKKSLADINRLLTGTLQLMKNDLMLRNIIVNRTPENNLPKILIDKNQMQQVFFNLINNAVDAMPDGGTITLTNRFLLKTNTIEIYLGDTGCGIKKEDLNRVFDPFYTTKDPGKGTGLGLPICKRIIQDHDGTIEIESTLGKGSVFIIRLPVL